MSINLATATLVELEEVKKSCCAMVTKRAVASGAAVLVPIPGTDIAADIGMLLELIPAINKQFGLSGENLNELNPQFKIFILDIIKKLGAQMAGQAITKQLILQALKKVGLRVAAKSVIKFIPFVGQVAAVAISVAAMKYVGNSQVTECYEVARRVILGRTNDAPAS
jgi:uncharacterized protein (DUF697 family)